MIFLLKAKYPDIYGDKATSGANNHSGHGYTVPRSTGFSIIENGVTEAFPLLGADPNSYHKDY
ncbi:hypothetical protein [Larkinella punicea]|uniref:hypothetical protein n=1 Tax=Larkinella punicea TaxID=2315727 RepID=UPI000DF21F84|nr:hypothetical protein [Larkinella punicea]